MVTPKCDKVNQMNKNKKGQLSNSIWGLVPVALALLVFGLVLTYGMDIQESEHEDMCPSADHFVVPNGTVGSSTGVNPVTSGKWGCCDTWNGTDCNVWQTSNYAVNSSFESLDAGNTISEKQGTVVNVIIAAVIIGLLLAAFGGYAMKSR